MSASIDEKLARVAARTAALDRMVSSDLAAQTRKLANLRRTNPEFPTKDYVAQTRFLHISDQFVIPIQNWKEGTPFYRKRPEKKTDYNVHSSKDLRCHRVLVSDQEIEYICGRRHHTALLEMPLHSAAFEIVPTHTEPVRSSRRVIWKQYM
jgi:hypothetical protein